MKQKIMMILLAALMGLLLLAGCNAGPSGSAITGAEKDAVLAYSEPMTDNLLKGLVDGDYAAFSRDFDAKMLEAIDQKKFDEMRKQLDGSIGTYQSRTVDQVMDYGQVITVISKGIFSKAANMLILTTFEKAEPHKISGLYFKNP